MARSGFSWELLVAVTSSAALHGLWLAREAKASYVEEARPAEVFFEPEVLPPPPPAPPAEPEAEPAKSEPVAPAPAPKPAAKAQVAKAEAAPPPAAQAGKTLTAPDNDNASAVADFTMVQGNGNAYVGGTTSALGTSTTAVRGAASDVPRPAAIASAYRPAVPSGPDRSRAAVPEAADWNCSRLFPTDPEAGDQATVVIAVTVQASGTPKSVAVLRDPGHGFGAAARACAMGQRFKPALDRDGNGVLATTPPITVRFSR